MSAPLRARAGYAEAEWEIDDEGVGIVPRGVKYSPWTDPKQRWQEPDPVPKNFRWSFERSFDDYEEEWRFHISADVNGNRPAYMHRLTRQFVEELQRNPELLDAWINSAVKTFMDMVYPRPQQEHPNAADQADSSFSYKTIRKADYIAGGSGSSSTTRH